MNAITIKNQQVIDAARRLFTKYGYRKVSMDEIARTSGVTKKTIYTYFKDKDDLIRYFLNEEIEKIKSKLDKIDKKDIPFIEKINETIMQIISHFMKSELLKAFGANELNSLELSKEYSDVIDSAILHEIKIRIEEGIKKGFIKPCDPEITSFIIYKMYTSLMHEWHEPIEKEKVAENIMRILKKGLLN